MAVDADAAEHEVTQEISNDDSELETSVNDAANSGDEPDGVRSPLKVALGAGMAAFIALAGVAGWLGFRVYEDHGTDQQRGDFVEIARQGAVNLTTIDYQNVDGDVQRILDSATGTFYDDFNSRKQPFVDVVKQAKSKSEGTVVDAGLESENGSEALVLVAVNVKTTMADGATQDPRSWRMRISVQKLDGSEFKVSNVAFVP